ncbi:uncharacterized protein DAT39_015742, partial [Clarias magur]
MFSLKKLWIFFSKHNLHGTVTVYRVPRGKSVYMAFGFELRKKMYFPVVAKDSEKQMCLK